MVGWGWIYFNAKTYTLYCNRGRFLLINFCWCHKTYSWFCCFCALSFTFKIILLYSYINCTRHTYVITYAFILIKVIFKIHKLVILTKFIVQIIKFWYGCWVNFSIYSLIKNTTCPWKNIQKSVPIIGFCELIAGVLD